MQLEEILEKYDSDKLTITTLGSHSALQILHGAKKEGFRTSLIVVPSRFWFYEQFKHLIDEFIIIDKWSDICRDDIVAKLQRSNSILVPHGSYVEYVGLSCAEGLRVPIFGLRRIYSIEASQKKKMELLRKAGIKTPREYRLGEPFEGLVIVKLGGAKGGRGYFIASTPEEVEKGVNKLRGKGLVDEVIIQEYVIGVAAYYHFFWSPVLNRLEILGMDIRYESNVDGLARIPAEKVSELGIIPSFSVVGNKPLVLRESLLPVVLDYGFRFVNTTKKHIPPGIIGPFCLESIITKDLDIIVFEFSGRIVAGTNLYLSGSPYSYLYWDEPMSTGRRIARELKLAVDKGVLGRVLT